MKQFSEQSLEELLKLKSKFKGALVGLIIVALVIASSYAYMYFFKSKNISIGSLIPLMVLPITWIPIFASLKSIDEEIMKRQPKQD